MDYTTIVDLNLDQKAACLPFLCVLDWQLGSGQLTQLIADVLRNVRLKRLDRKELYNQIRTTYPKILCNPIVFESICYLTRANRLVNESNTLDGFLKNWTGMVLKLIRYLGIDDCDEPILLAESGNSIRSRDLSPLSLLARPFSIPSKKFRLPVVLLSFTCRFALVR